MRVACPAGGGPASIATMEMSAFELTELGGSHEGEEGHEPAMAISGVADMLCRDAEHRLRRRTQPGGRNLQAAGSDSVEPGRCARRAKRRRGRRSHQARLLHGLYQMDQGQSFQPAA